MKVFTRNTEGDHFVCCSAYWKCTIFYWKCQNWICIRKEYVCDGKDDCGDSSDERNCCKLFFMTVVYVDRKPESYGTTYLQTPMIGSGAPAQMTIPHLLRNQIFQ